MTLEEAFSMVSEEAWGSTPAGEDVYVTNEITAEYSAEDAVNALYLRASHLEERCRELSEERDALIAEADAVRYDLEVALRLIASIRERSIQ